VLSNLKKNSKNKANDKAKASNNFRTYDQFWFGNEYFKAHSQGGLATPCNDLVKLLEVV
jgi:hypothetical protein